MKTLPAKFLESLLSLLNKNDKRAEKFLQQITDNPEDSAKLIVSELGSDTQRIKL